MSQNENTNHKKTLELEPHIIPSGKLDKLLIGNSGLAILFTNNQINFFDFTPERNCSGIATEERLRQYAITFCGAMGSLISTFKENSDIGERLRNSPIMVGETNERFYNYMERIFGSKILKGCLLDGLLYEFKFNLTDIANNTELSKFLMQMESLAMNQEFEF